MSQYPVPPTILCEREPLLADSSHNAGSVFDQPEVDDLPDDFKKAFIRKVYSILLSQIFATVIVVGVISQSKPLSEWVINHLRAFFVPLVAALVNLGLLHWKRHSHPWNFVLLSTFTLLEAYTIGFAVTFYENGVVFQALVITLAVFIGLTLFTLQSKRNACAPDLSLIDTYLIPFLFAALIVLLATSAVHFLVAPFNRTLDIVYTLAGCLVFSGCVVYDTYRINRKLSPDEFISGAISLDLDFISLFLRILRLGR
ncbi:UPF0005-domain-containing protein [Mycena olivaceomarginata]|nr:UPF0005-domain-containing protein [Mycena olivaceomarginata]